MNLTFCRMAKISTLSSLLAISSYVFTSAPVLAQGADQSGGFLTIEEIVVTARRVEERAQEVPIALTAIQGDDVEKLNINDADDLQHHSSNLYIRYDSLGGSLQPSFILRGQIQTLTTDENVAFYVADVPQSTRGISGALYDLAQIQVLKGPQGTLFGKNSNSGAVVVTPNRPEYELGGWVKGEVGNYGLQKYTGVLNVPLLDNKLAVRLAGNITKQDGTVDNTLSGYDDWDDQEHETFRGSLLFEPTDRLSNLTVFDYLHRDEVPNPYRTVGYGLGAFFGFAFQQIVPQQQALGLYKRPGVTGRNARGPDGGYMTNEMWAKVWGISNTTEFEINDNFTIKNVYGYRREKSSSSLDLSGGAYFDVFLGGPTDPVVALANLTITGHDLTSKSDELQLIGNLFDDKLNFIVGGFYSDADDGQRTRVELRLDVAFPGTPFADDDVQYYKSKALFGEATLDLSSFVEGLKFTSGLRHTWDKRAQDKRFFARSFTTVSSNPDDFPRDVPWPFGVCGLTIPGTATLQPGVTAEDCIRRDSRKFDDSSYNETLAWQATDNINVYASYKKGYKSGGLNQYARGSASYAPYEPETLKVWELGLKTDGGLADGEGSWYANFSYYNGKYDNLQTQAIPDFSADFGLPPQSQIALVIINSVKADTQGFEFEGGVTFGDISANGYYSWLDQEFTEGRIPNNSAEYISGTGDNIKGTVYPGAPEQTAGGSLTYRMGFLPDHIGDVSATATVSWHGKAPDNPSPAVNVAEVPSYTLVDLSMQWTNVFGTAADIGFWVKNATDEDYKISCLRNELTLGYNSCVFGRQRTLGLSLKYRFGDEV